MPCAVLWLTPFRFGMKAVRQSLCPSLLLFWDSLSLARLVWNSIHGPGLNWERPAFAFPRLGLEVRAAMPGSEHTFIGCDSGADLGSSCLPAWNILYSHHPLGGIPFAHIWHFQIFGYLSIPRGYTCLLFCCCRKPWWSAALGREGLLGLQFQWMHSIMGTGALAAGVWGWLVTCHVQEWSHPQWPSKAPPP